MIRHTVLYKLKEYTPENATRLVDVFMSMQGKIPQLIDISAGVDKLRSERSYDVILECIFKNMEDLKIYTDSDVHKPVAEYVKQNVEVSKCVDCEIESFISIRRKAMYKAKINLQDSRSITLKLDGENAPISVENFVKLAKEGFYEGLIFHRVIPNFMIQGGGHDVELNLKEQPPTIKGEFRSNGVNNPLRHKKGTISMARTAMRDSASSQFFICSVDCPHLDDEYAAFGCVADALSMKVVEDISKCETAWVQIYKDVPVKPIIIKNIEIEEI